MKRVHIHILSNNCNANLTIIIRNPVIARRLHKKKPLTFENRKTYKRAKMRRAHERWRPLAIVSWILNNRERRRDEITWGLVMPRDMPFDWETEYTSNGFNSNSSFLLAISFFVCRIICKIWNAANQGWIHQTTLSQRT